MAKKRVTILLTDKEIAQVKHFCDTEGYAFGRWMRKVVLKSAGIELNKNVTTEEDEKDLF